MASFSRKTGIVGALVIAGVLVVGAYIISGPGLSFFTQTANAESTQALLKTYAQRDTDGDGLPDWEEALYGLDPNNPHSFSPTMTDGEAVARGLVKPKFSTAATATASTSVQSVLDSIPGQVPAENTLTAQFSQDFMQSYIDASQGQQLSAADEQTLLTNLMADFTQRAQAAVQSTYTLVDVRTSTSVSPGDYIGNVEAILTKYDVSEGNGDPVTLMQAYMENGDMSAKGKLQTLGDSYASIAKALSLVSAPPALTNDHLQLMQSFDTLGKATHLVVNYQQDPVATMGALSVYQPAGQTMSKALKDIVATVVSVGEPSAGQPGALLIQKIREPNQ